MKNKWNKRLHTPSLYLCTTVIYRTVRYEKRGIYSYTCHCPVTGVQRYRDGVCSLLFHLFFIICHPYIPLQLEDFWLCQCTIYNIGAKNRFVLYMQLSFPSSLLAISSLFIATVFHAKREEIFHLLVNISGELDPHITYGQDPQSLVTIMIPMIRDSHVAQLAK